MPEAMQARRIHVSGQVQGVGYRYFARHVAEQLHLAGYVRNLADGRVEVYAIGTQSQFENLIAELQHGPRHAIIENLDIENAEMLEEFSSDFTIE